MKNGNKRIEKYVMAAINKLREELGTDVSLGSVEWFKEFITLKDEEASSEAVVCFVAIAGERVLHCTVKATWVSGNVKIDEVKCHDE